MESLCHWIKMAKIINLERDNLSWLTVLEDLVHDRLALLLWIWDGKIGHGWHMWLRRK